MITSVPAQLPSGSLRQASGLAVTYEQFYSALDTLVDDSGANMDLGCSEGNIDEMARRCKQHTPNRPVCVVAQWKWVDSELTRLGKIGDSESLTYSFLYANRIIRDSRNRGFNSVFTSPFKTLTDGCLFHTQNSIYMLVGPGKRIYIQPDVVALLRLI
ncbi:DUF6957 family protein [Marinimicrobium sp. C2-29]|uniref:DUF6957 family protein n=1 Tax=Marinimicrobium sp. C2-29 TaxID=3139825 RepID=UPI0031393D53